MDLAAENRALRAALAAREAELRASEASLHQRQAELATREAENEALRARLEVADQVARRLQHELELLKRQLKGPRSERVVDPNQLPLPLPPDENAPVEAGDGAEPDEPEKKRKKRRKNKGRRDLAEMNHLPTVEHVSTVEDRSCPCGCGSEAVTIGHEVTWRLEVIRARFIRHKNVQEKVAYPDHREQGVVTAPPAMDYALPKAMCGNGLLAQVVSDKYVDHMPLFRQAQRFTRQGVELHRSTLSRWAMELGELLRPIVTVLAHEVLSGTWLRADATGMPVLDRSRTKGKAHHGHIWAWGNYDSVLFSYTPNKQASTVAALVEGFQGVVV